MPRHAYTTVRLHDHESKGTRCAARRRTSRPGTRTPPIEQIILSDTLWMEVDVTQRKEISEKGNF